MKNALYFIALLAGLFTVSCEDGIDPITKVDPGADAAAPQITINSPAEGVEIQVFEEVTTLNIDLEVTDDIEIAEVRVFLDGDQIAFFNTFKDYRIFIEEFTYDQLEDGDHTLRVVATDIDGKTSTQEVNFSKSPPYQAQFPNERFYMPFDGNFMDLISFQEAEVVGDPGFSEEAYVGPSAYSGAEDSYLTFPMDGLKNQEFSAAFWYKVDSSPDRAGILIVSDDTDRNQGFRLFREGSADEQRIKLNVGTGSGESWNDGGVIDVTAGQWVHIAFSISAAETTIYFNGMEMLSATLSAPIDWTGAETLYIGAGGPTFDYWNHKSDYSAIDELRIFDKALTATDIQIMINAINPYIPTFPGESLYMPFDGDYIDMVGSQAASQTGSPGFTDDSQEGSQAFAGAADSYLTYPSDGLTSSSFSGSFWYKVNADPDRAGILVIGDDETDRNQGFRLFREGSATEQRIKLNVGTGGGESWNDGDVIDATAGEWVHVAFTIGPDESNIYFNGQPVNSAAMSAPIDWTGVGDFVIGAGGPTFSYWNHLSDASSMDELRFYSKELTPEEVMEVYGGGYAPAEGEVFYLPFNGSYNDLVGGVSPTVEGMPGFAGEAAAGTDAYAGAADSYLTVPAGGLTSATFSATFWYKMNADPTRAGILVISPEDTENAGYPDTQNLRTNGFRFFREGDATRQVFKLNVGTGDGEVWVDGGDNAALDPATDTEWVHFAFTISESEAVVYINGEVAASNSISGIDWSGCDFFSIGSGDPRFNEWGHLADLSYLDELRFFDKALTQEEVQANMNM